MRSLSFREGRNLLFNELLGFCLVGMGSLFRTVPFHRFSQSERRPTRETDNSSQAGEDAVELRRRGQGYVIQVHFGVWLRILIVDWHVRQDSFKRTIVLSNTWNHSECVLMNK